MADPSEDDVPTVTSVAGEESAADAEDRTIQKAPESEPDADPTTAIARPPVTPLAPATPPRPRAPSVPFAAEPPTQPKLAGDAALATTAELEESVTATAPRVHAPNLPLSLPKQVEIRTLESEDDDVGEETEVRTLAGSPSPIALPTVASEADAPDDSVTTQAPTTPRLPSSPDLPTEAAGVIRISPKSLMPSVGASRASDVYDDESVTSRGPAVGSAYADDSVTTQAPSITAKGLPPAIDGETEGTTKKVRKRSDDDAESITEQAPGHLTNMLRVIAADKSAPAGAAHDDDDDPDDPIQAHTQVMANAPLKPSDLGAHVARNGAALARELEPTSESGLRIAQPEGPDIDRASLGALGVPPHDRRMANMALVPPPDSARSKTTQPPTTYAPPELEGEKKPPYALLVGIVALISVAIPAVLFIVLNQSGGELVPRVAAQPSPDPVGRADVPRARAKPSAMPSASAPRRSPFRR